MKMENKPIAAHCDSGCEKVFTITKIRTRKVKNGIEKNYFICPHCKQEYITYYASAETLKLQKEMRKLHVNMRGVDVTQFNLDEAMLKAKIKQSMDAARVIAEA